MLETPQSSGRAQPLSLCRSSPQKQPAIVQGEEVLICKHGGVILISGRQSAISGPAGGGCSPHLPWMWLFQHCSSSGSATLPALQMLSGRLDQKRFDSPSFPMTSTTCNRNQRHRNIISVVPYLKLIHTETTRRWDGLKRTCLKKRVANATDKNKYISKSFSPSCYRLLWSTFIHIVFIWLIQDRVGVLGTAGSPQLIQSGLRQISVWVSDESQELALTGPE